MPRARITGPQVAAGIAAVLLSALFAACAAAQTQAQAPTASARTQNGKALSPLARAQQAYFQTLATFLLDHDRAKAERGFMKVTQIDPDYVAAWFNLGVFAEADRNWAEAQSFFEQYLHLAPKGSDAERAKSQLLVLAKYISGTVTAQESNQAEYDATIQRANAFLATGLYREAIAEAGRAEAADATRWEAYAVVSMCMAKQKKQADAEKFEAMAVSHAPVDKRGQVKALLDMRITEPAK